MISVPGIYKNGKITLLEEIPHVQEARVIVTVLEAWPEAESPAAEPEAGAWLGSMSHTLVGELGDLVSPLEETWSDWEVLRS
jgi:hypothetical protein